jgi:hypothetical protein
MIAPALPTWLNPPGVARRTVPSGHAVETALPNRVRRRLQEVVGYKNQNTQNRSIFSVRNSLSTGVAIRVRDNGAGMSESVKARMLRRPAHPKRPAPAPRGKLRRRRRHRPASHAPRRARTMPAPSTAPVRPPALKSPPRRPSRPRRLRLCQRRNGARRWDRYRRAGRPIRALSPSCAAGCRNRRR